MTLMPSLEPEAAAERSDAAARVNRIFLLALVPAFFFWGAGAYVRITSDSEPLWTEFGTPLLLGLVGARTLALPEKPDAHISNRTMGMVLLVMSALILLLILLDS
jgi:hypothetical protein